MEKRKEEKRIQKKFQQCVFLLHKILQPSVGVYKIWRLALFGAEKSVMKNFIGEKETNDKYREW